MMHVWYLSVSLFVTSKCVFSAVKMSTSVVLAVVVIISSSSLSRAVRPIIFISGIDGSEDELASVKEFVLPAYPDANITTVTEFHGIKGYTEMWTQVEKTHELIRPVLDSAPDGVTMICLSQGMYTCEQMW